MIGVRDVWKEIKKPEEVTDDDPILKLIYKAVCMCIRLILDVRHKVYYGDSAKPQKKNFKKDNRSKADSQPLSQPVLKASDFNEDKK